MDSMTMEGRGGGDGPRPPVMGPHLAEGRTWEGEDGALLPGVLDSPCQESRTWGREPSP